MKSIYYKSDQDQDFQILSEPREGCWIHIDKATRDEVNEIASLINADVADLIDCLDKYEIPRVERIEQHVIIFTRHPASQEIGLHTTTLAIILTKDYIITVCPQKSSIIENFVLLKPRIATNQTSKFLLYILLKITQEFTHQIKKIRTNVLKQEKRMVTVDSEDITALTINEENLNQYLSTLVPHRNVLESIASGKYTLLYEEDQDILEDLLNASIQSEDLCAINLRSIRSLRDSYQIIFTNQLNKTIKLLTALTIILSIPTMVASIYGMNVQLPIANQPFAFVFILLFISVISFTAILLFQRKRWL